MSPITTLAITEPSTTSTKATLAATGVSSTLPATFEDATMANFVLHLSSAVVDETKLAKHEASEKSGKTKGASEAEKAGTSGWQQQ